MRVANATTPGAILYGRAHEGWGARTCLIELTLKLSLVLATALCVGWGLVLVRVFRTTNAFRVLPRGTDDADSLDQPRVSAVLASRDEADAVLATVRTLLDQRGVDIEVVVVDDMSSDDSVARLKSLVAEVGEQRLLLIEQKKLPPGWIAKNYAVEIGQGRARGDWLLFTEPRALLGPNAVKNAITAMQQERLDHIAVFPRLEAGSFLEALVLPLFVLLYQLRLVDPEAADPASGHGAGIGAFNLVRADSYRLRGTHARIRGSILDDRALAIMMRDEGGRGTVMRAVGQVRQRPYQSLRDLYFGIKKSVLPQFANSAVLSVVAAAVLVFAVVAPTAFVLAGVPLWRSGVAPWLLLPATIAMLLPLIGLLKARTMVRFEPIAVLLFPVGALFIATSALHAAIVFGTRGTLEWQGRTYTKNDLKNVS